MANNTSDPPQRDEKLPGVGDCTSTETRFKVFEFCHKWTIHKFSCLKMKTGEEIESSAFASKSNDAVKWTLKLFPYGVNKTSEGYLSFFLQPIDDPPSAFNAEYVLSIIDSSGKISNDLSVNHTFEKSEDFGFQKFIKRTLLKQNKDKLLSGDILVLLCKGSYTTDSTVVSESCEAVQYPIPVSKALDDFGSLLETQQFCDVIIDVCGMEFHAHKAILSARSAVFSAMLNNKMKEQKKNRVTITDTDPEIFEELLRFIYSDKAPKLKDVAAELICIADKYAVLRLKEMCAASLIDRLSVDNALDTLILADLHSAEELKSNTLDFIASHAQAVVNTERYKSMVKTHPQLVAEASTTVILRQMGNVEEENSLLPQ